MIKWNSTPEEMLTINKIAKRAHAIATKYIGKKQLPDDDLMTWDMDITACHCNGTPLKLNELLAADDENFIHDVFGIRNHINRSTGKLEDCFLPRYAAL